MPPRSRRDAALALLGLLAATRARAGFDFWTSEYTASRVELQALIARQFPRTQRYGEFVRLTLSDPALGLDPAGNRAAVTTRIAIASPFLPVGTVGGTVALSGALRYDAPARTLRLDRPRVERFELQGLRAADAQRLQQIGAPIAEDLLNGQPLRTFTAEELTFGSKTYEIGEITVLTDGIKVELR